MPEDIKMDSCCPHCTVFPKTAFPLLKFQMLLYCHPAHIPNIHRFRTDAYSSPLLFRTLTGQAAFPPVLSHLSSVTGKSGPICTQSWKIHSPVLLKMRIPSVPSKSEILSFQVRNPESSEAVLLFYALHKSQGLIVFLLTLTPSPYKPVLHTPSWYESVRNFSLFQDFLCG